MSSELTARPVVWSVAGSDSGGGAGLQADLRAFDAFDVHGCSVVAAVTAQNSTAVARIEPVGIDLLDAQLTALSSDMPPAAIKTGMLGTAANVQLMAQWIDRLRAQQPGLAVVVDPVLRSSTGAAFADAAMLHAYRSELLARASLVTPNRSEAAALLGVPRLTDRFEVEQAALSLLALGCQSVVITGGDEVGDASQDYLATPHASGWLSLARLATPNNHGTGCVFAASAAAALARGFVAADAIVLAKMATTHALHHGYAVGRGAGPVRARAGFALHSQNLPALTRPGQHEGSGFPPLLDPDLGLYAVVDSAAWVRRVLDAGVRTVQLRIKDPRHPALQQEVRDSIAAAHAAGAQMFINDHWELAIALGAYGVHLGQEDLATADLAAIADAGLRLGVSTHSYWEVCRAWALKPSYIACGPIHATQAKAMPWLPQGPDNLAYWCKLLPVPVVAIAGMDTDRAAQAMQCGAAGVAVISAITGAGSAEPAIARLRQALHAGRSLPRRASPELAQTTLQRTH
jgi:hydroxymethylpyrimidine kinase / phosphomethylpyrimidine kinase / thiamine-phosphate diphosphorylase